MPSGESLATSGASARRPKSSTGAKGCGGGHLPFESRGKQEPFPPLGILGEAARSAGSSRRSIHGSRTKLPASPSFQAAPQHQLPVPSVAKPQNSPRLLQRLPAGAGSESRRAQGSEAGALRGSPTTPRRGSRCRGGPAGGPGVAVSPPDLALLAAVALAHPAPRGSSGAAPGVSPLRTRGPGELAGEGSQAQLSAPWGASSPPAPGLLLIPERRARKEPRDAAAELPGHVPGVLASRGRDERGSRGAQGRRPPSRGAAGSLTCSTGCPGCARAAAGRGFIPGRCEWELRGARRLIWEPGPGPAWGRETPPSRPHWWFPIQPGLARPRRRVRTATGPPMVTPQRDFTAAQQRRGLGAERWEWGHSPARNVWDVSPCATQDPAEDGH